MTDEPTSKKRASNPRKVVSAKRAAAARDNGAKSRGPKTDEGKQISSRNAVRHGLLAARVAPSAENSYRPIFDEVLGALTEKFQPIAQADEIAIALLASEYVHLLRAYEMLETVMSPPKQPGRDEKLQKAFACVARLGRLDLALAYLNPGTAGALSAEDAGVVAKILRDDAEVLLSSEDDQDVWDGRILVDMEHVDETELDANATPTSKQPISELDLEDEKMRAELIAAVGANRKAVLDVDQIAAVLMGRRSATKRLRACLILMLDAIRYDEGYAGDLAKKEIADAEAAEERVLVNLADERVVDLNLMRRYVVSIQNSIDRQLRQLNAGRSPQISELPGALPRMVAGHRIR